LSLILAALLAPGFLCSCETPGRFAVTPTQIADKVWAFSQSHPDGFTLDVFTGTEPKEGIAVSYAATQGSHSREQLDKVVEHALRHDGYVGGWLDASDGLYYFDSTRLFPEDALDDAIRFGKENGQRSAFVLSSSTDIPIPTETTTPKEKPGMTIHDFTAKGRNGTTLDLASLKGKVLLVVNTATGCGFTPQYEGLEKLYSKHHAAGLELLDFPCDQFGHQAPGSDDEIHEFCALKYNTTFDQLAKIEVNGPGADPIYVFLKAARPKDDATDEAVAGLRDLLKKHGLAGAEAPGDIEWNFTKFLVDREGNVVKRFHPTTAPEEIDAEIVKLLQP
jgi:glutathione peroxidase